ncbi:hypothetical protein C2I18_14485 [Paenibacillus sp. PK3_47]|nr:hypothetical protein C2I18_14485 [Paenibacillus sp. PK3_47]
MLEDTLRKLLRIMVQFRYHFKRMPDIKELGRLSGRRPAEIIKGFKVFAAEEYINWVAAEPVEAAVILMQWGRGRLPIKRRSRAYNGPTLGIT